MFIWSCCLLELCSSHLMNSVAFLQFYHVSIYFWSLNQSSTRLLTFHQFIFSSYFYDCNYLAIVIPAPIIPLQQFLIFPLSCWVPGGLIPTVGVLLYPPPPFCNFCVFSSPFITLSLRSPISSFQQVVFILLQLCINSCSIHTFAYIQSISYQFLGSL